MPDATSSPPVETLTEATILFAGDSGDGMQLTGTQFTQAAAHARNDLATLPDYPAEIRAPAGTTYGVSAFQLRFGSGEIRTPGDEVDLLVAMNPAALKVHLHRVREGGALIVNANSFTERDLELAELEQNPLESGLLEGYQVFEVELTRLTQEALEHTDLSRTTVGRTKNMFALGLALWLYSRPLEPTQQWLQQKFADEPEIRDANLHVLSKGYHYGETTDAFVVRYDVAAADLAPGTYRSIRGAQAIALGLVAASKQSGLPLFYGSYPITPASDLLHELSRYKHFGVMTFQAEDEIAAAGAAVGASFGGNLGVCATSGPGVALKTETIGLGVMTELPLVIIDMQRGGPSTGLPTKTEQSDLLQAVYGRNGEAPLPVLAASSPADCFDTIYEACRIATRYMTPVIFLADGYLGNGSEPWRIPDVADLPAFDVSFATTPTASNGQNDFLPYARDPDTLARPWAKPGTKGLEHRIGGLEKAHETGNVSYDPANHQRMVKLRAEKVQRVTDMMPPTPVYGDPDGALLVIGWGSTRGAIEAAVDRVRASDARVGHVHLRHVHPFPADLGPILRRFDKILVPELNNGQLIRLLRDQFTRSMTPLNKIQGQPFHAQEVEAALREALVATPA